LTLAYRRPVGSESPTHPTAPTSTSGANLSDRAGVSGRLDECNPRYCVRCPHQIEGALENVEFGLHAALHTSAKLAVVSGHCYGGHCYAGLCGEVLGLVIRQGLVWTLAGASIGLIAVLAVTRFLTSILYGIATDSATLVAVSLTLGGVIVTSSYVPARRATSHSRPECFAGRPASPCRQS
jgi:hypothetical protein